MDQKKLLNNNIQLRVPTKLDGLPLHSLVKSCPPLDENSVYCNLLQCTHFADTSVVAHRETTLIGAITGFIRPDQPDTLFIWQVAVSEQARGGGLATLMLKFILGNQSENVTYLETTITESNSASWALFTRLAEKLSATLQQSVMFDKYEHFAGQHDSEILIRIGPFSSSGQ